MVKMALSSLNVSRPFCDACRDTSWQFFQPGSFNPRSLKEFEEALQQHGPLFRLNQLPSTDRERARQRFVESCSAARYGMQLGWCAASLGYWRDELAETFRRDAFRLFLTRARSLDDPPCDELARLAEETDLAKLVDLLKWPTCPDYTRAQVVKRLGELTKQPFVLVDKNSYLHPDFAAVAAWADRQGLHPDDPPALPQGVN